MYRELWGHCKSSVCSIDFLSNAGTKIISFTGFKVKNYLVTDDVIDKFAKPAEVLLRFTESDLDSSGCLRMNFSDFIERKVKVNDKHNPGYMLFEIDQAAFKAIPPLKCSKRINHKIGHPIAVLGHDLDQECRESPYML